MVGLLAPSEDGEVAGVLFISMIEVVVYVLRAFGDGNVID